MAYDWAPEVQDVAELLRARTAERDTGEELGTFTESTRPTSTAVQSLVTRAAGEVAGGVKAPITSEQHEAARNLAALRAAMWVELSYFPEQVDSGQSPYAEYKALYTEGLAALAGELEVETGVDPDTGGYGMPVFGFPVECKPLGEARW
jgi:hypothetical protein